MLTVVAIAAAVIWVAVIALVWAVAISAKRGDADDHARRQRDHVMHEAKAKGGEDKRP